MWEEGVHIYRTLGVLNNYLVINNITINVISVKLINITYKLISILLFFVLFINLYRTYRIIKFGLNCKLHS